MIITNIKLLNWMIFKGAQEIKFSDGTENITLVFGENMHGKTCLHNAIRWCLYGSAINRQLNEIPVKEIINSEAFKTDGKTDVSVNLDFKVDGAVYELQRTIDYSSIQPEIKKHLRIDGRVIDGGKVDLEINKVLPQQISQFILFDGELLRNFEKLVVAEGSTQAIGIKNAIDETLGIPLLQKAYEESVTVTNKLKVESKKELQKDNTSRLVLNKLQELETKRDTKVNEQTQFQEAIHTLTPQFEELSEKLHDGQEAVKLIGQRISLEESLKSYKIKYEEVQDALKEISEHLWLIPLRRAVGTGLERYKEQLQSLRNTASSQANKEIQVLKLEKSLLSSTCSTCGANISESKISDMQSELDQLKDEYIPQDELNDLIFQKQTKIKSLNLGENGIDETQKYKILKDQKTELDRDQVTCENQIYEIDQKLKDVDEQTSITNRNKYDAINREIGVLQADFKKYDEDIQEIDQQIKTIKKSPEYQTISSSSEIVSKTEKAEKIQEILKYAMVLYRDRMRSEVQKRATLTFQELTTEPKFDQLEINENYGLSLIVDGAKVNRSAGAEQIVAMSLIEALNFNGRRAGPMIMDTPVGRLDNTHRKNIVEYLPKVVTQLVIFAHSGELATDNNFVDPSKVGAKYKLQRQSIYHSEILEI